MYTYRFLVSDHMGEYLGPAVAIDDEPFLSAFYREKMVVLSKYQSRNGSSFVVNERKV